ncbi:PilZ domain-containing protein [Trichlorobacter ammonificans]|uniref:PilZ domain-containing protein n=1 Tax=Trichlorobacter ammonificans TaxID=2916410 RepID=A0ABM9D6U6_9BACT|nr:PilZ domain-containing protein [Trichlorobacter ammonificans]CAH2030924.1 PilZ domain-containing protein [Trichlorobacter ammonificans]
MAPPVILVISRSETRMQTYREALERVGASCVGLADLKGAPVLAASTPMNGIAIDMPVQIKASSGDKALVEDMLLALPSVYLNIAPATDAIRILTATGTQGTFQTFEQFVAACANFNARVVRPKNRTELNLNALLYPSMSGDVPPERTVTINVSPGGCFLFSSHPDYHVEQLVRIDFVGFEDRTPIIGSVRWLQPWGTSHLIPGIGVRFEQISAAQQMALDCLLKALEPR